MLMALWTPHIWDKIYDRVADMPLVSLEDTGRVEEIRTAVKAQTGSS